MPAPSSTRPKMLPGFPLVQAADVRRLSDTLHHPVFNVHRAYLRVSATLQGGTCPCEIKVYKYSDCQAADLGGIAIPTMQAAALAASGVRWPQQAGPGVRTRDLT